MMKKIRCKVRITYIKDKLRVCVHNIHFLLLINIYPDIDAEIPPKGKKQSTATAYFMLMRLLDTNDDDDANYWVLFPSYNGGVF